MRYMNPPPTPAGQATAPVTEQHLATLTEIGQTLSSTLEVRDAFSKVMQIISDKLHMRRGTLVLLDESTGRLRTVAASGLNAEDIERNRFALGEGITGNVVATGRPRIIADVRSDPNFLNRTKRLNLEPADVPISF